MYVQPMGADLFHAKWQKDRQNNRRTYRQIWTI